MGLFGTKSVREGKGMGRDGKPKTEHQLVLRIETKPKEIDINFVESLMDRVKQKIKIIGQD